MTVSYSPEELAFMDRHTYRPPTPLPEATAPVESPVHPSPAARQVCDQLVAKALQSIKGELGPKQSELLRLLEGAKRPACDLEISKSLGWTISSTTARRNELVEMGKVAEAGRWINPATGKRSVYWKAVTAEVQR